LTTLQFGVITVRRGKEEFVFTVAGGVAEVQPDQVTVLADAAENVLEIDVQRAEAARQRAEEMLKNAPSVDSDEYLRLVNTLRKSTLRLDAVRRYRQGRHQIP
jgi:F-type H+-transporting ATPase subunit epsilon